MDKKALKRDLLVYFIVFGTLTLPFIFTGLDITCQMPFYSDTNGWYLSALPFWDFIYKYGIFLGYFLAVAALVVVSVSYWSRIIAKWRRAAYFLLFVMIVGPGLLVNGTFKEHWGHPRPREIKEFGGTDNYVKVWAKGPGKGKSFPCGHASMGFFMSIPFLFLRKRYRTWAWVFFIFGSLYGLLIGVARMLAGGHFASDVLWASGMVWMVGILAFHFFKVDKEVDTSDFDSSAQRKKRRLSIVLTGIVLPILTVALLLATPYISHRTFTKERNELEKVEMSVLNTYFNEGVITVGFGADYIVDFNVNAFGFPNSKFGWEWQAADTAQYYLTHIGWFTEVRNEIDLQIPENSVWKNILDVNEGEIFLTVPTDTIPRNLEIIINKGNVNLYAMPNARFSLKTNGLAINNTTAIVPDSLNIGALTLSVTINNEGTLNLRTQINE